MTLILAIPTSLFLFKKIHNPWVNHILAFVVAAVLVGAVVTLIPR